MDDVQLIKSLRLKVSILIFFIVVVSLSLSVYVAKGEFVRSLLYVNNHHNVNILGDSISHGAFALDISSKGWVRVFENYVNSLNDSKNYGFTPMPTLGSGIARSSDIHSVNYVGEHGPLPYNAVQSSLSPSGFVMRLPDVGSRITLTIPDFQSFARINYIQQPGGGSFAIYVNGVPVERVDSSGPLAWRYVEFSLWFPRSNTYAISIVTTSNQPVDIVGPSYLSWFHGPVFNNYSQSGRRLRDASEQVIKDIVSDSSVLIMALGHNDQWESDKDDSYFIEFSKRIDWIAQYAKQNGVRVIVPDFCWTAPADSRTRSELRRLAVETSGTYIDLPGKIFEGRVPSARYLVDDLKMWWEGSHPNPAGHAWIAQEITRAVQAAAGGDVKGWLQRGASRP